MSSLKENTTNKTDNESIWTTAASIVVSWQAYLSLSSLFVKEFKNGILNIFLKFISNNDFS